MLITIVCLIEFIVCTMLLMHVINELSTNTNYIMKCCTLSCLYQMSAYKHSYPKMNIYI